MSLAISTDHVALAQTVSDFLAKHDSLAAARGLLSADEESLPPFWETLSDVGWLGLHVSEDHGGSGFGLPELVIVVEEFGRAMAPGPFVTTVITSALISASASPEVCAQFLSGLCDGSRRGAVALSEEIDLQDGYLSGTAGVCMGAGLADVLLLPVGDDVAVIDRSGGGIDVDIPTNLDPTRRSARVTLDRAPAMLIRGARQLLIDLTRLLFAAEATGIARQCTEQASSYAKIRHQFGRPIATFQAVKHHCANMLVATELATAAVWDAARAGDVGGEEFTFAAAMAASLALPAADLNAQLNVQVHGGIGFTWEHDAHLFLRRASALQAMLGVDAAAHQVTQSVRLGIKRSRKVDLPPEAEPIRQAVRQFVDGVRGLDPPAQREALISSGYVMPHWPKPWGRDAEAIEQLIVEQEFAAGGIRRPNYGITGWVILTLIQHATAEQVDRWVRPALNREVIWCQLFSEPDAGSDAAGIKARGTRVDGGWLVNGQKVWTSGAHLSSFGLATVRTNPDVPKHEGITTMVIDMRGPGVEVRPLKMPTGESDFNEVFLSDVFVPDQDVVGPIGGGWTVARATLGNESVSIGGGQGGMSMQGHALIGPLDAHPDRLAAGVPRIGRYIASAEAMEALNLRSAHRAVHGGGPGPEGNITKLVLSELGHEAAAILAALTGPDGVYLSGPGMMSGTLVLMHRAMSIAGGTSEIKRNQIGERILGLPRDPLIV